MKTVSKSSSKDDSADLNVYIHGIREIQKAKSWLRVLWSLLVLVCIVGLVMQMVSVTQEFLKDEVGTVEQSYLPPRLPPFMICPRFPALNVSNFTTRQEEVAKYITGYFPMSPAYFDNRDNPQSWHPDTAEEAEKIRNYFNRSLVTMQKTLAHSKDRVIKKIEVYPGLFNKNEATINVVATLQGPCYQFVHNAPLTAVNMEFMQIIVDLHSEIDGTYDNDVYRVFVGDDATIGYRPGFNGHIGLSKNKRYNIDVRVKRSIQYKGMSGKRCSGDTLADYHQCFTLAANDVNCKDMCKTMVLPTAKYQEVVYEQACNMYRDFPCTAMAALATEQTEAAVTAKCQLPCERNFYDQSVQIADYGNIRVVVGMDDPGFSSKITEYQLVSLSDYLSSVGGTAGLWFGASIVSIVQLLVVGAACTKKKKVEDDM